MVTTPIHTGFDGVTFRILPERGDGVYPDWNHPPIRPVFSIPNSHSAVVQHMGSGLATISFLVEMDSVDDYRDLCRKQGVTGTLTLLAGYTRAVGSEPKYHLDGRDYEDIDGVELVDITDVAFAAGLEYVQARVTFSRAMNPLTGEAA